MTKEQEKKLLEDYANGMSLIKVWEKYCMVLGTATKLDELLQSKIKKLLEIERIEDMMKDVEEK
jgi:hypothetical protein